MLLSAFLAGLSLACSTSLHADAASFQAKAHELVGRLSPEERVGQLLLIGVQGRGRVSDETLGLVSSLGPGGILLFGFNVPERAAELAPALGALQDAARVSGAGLPLFIAIDHEGGSVFRFGSGVTRPPSPLETAARGPEFAGLLGGREGLELGALGINMVLGPVVERLTEDNKEFIGNRAYGRDARRVDEVAGAYIEGLGRAGLLSAAKHFPGNSLVDPHRSLPTIEVTRAAFIADYLPRFAEAVRHGVPAIMLSHVLVPSVDPKRPATLSAPLIDLLRKKADFSGLVLTDDLLMKALGQDSRLSAVEALAAGADLLMLSSEEAAIPVRDAILAALRDGRLSPSRVREAAERVIAAKLRFGLAKAFDVTSRARAIAELPGLVAESAELLGKLGHRSK